MIGRFVTAATCWLDLRLRRRVTLVPVRPASQAALLVREVDR